VTGLSGSAIVLAATPYAPVQRTNIDRAVPAGASLLPNGRLVSPAGRTVDQGDFPEAVALSPDGVLAATTQVGQGDGSPGGDDGTLCVDGQRKNPCANRTQLGAFPATSPDEYVLVTNLVSGAKTVLKGTQTLCNPTAGTTAKTLHCNELGVAFSRDGTRLFATGGGNDAVYAFTVDPAAQTVTATPTTTTYLTGLGNVAPGGSASYQKPNPGTQAARTKGLTLTDNGLLLVTKEQAGTLDVLKARDLSFVTEVLLGPQNPTGANGSVIYPYQVVAAPSTTTAAGTPAAETTTRAFVTLQGTASLATVTLTTTAAGTTGTLTDTTPVGDHPTGLALSPAADELLVTNANDDSVSQLPLTNGLPTTATTLSLLPTPGTPVGKAPNAVAYAGPGTAYVTLAGDNALLALNRTASGAFAAGGSLPTGWYPTSVAVRTGMPGSPGIGDLLVVSAKGLGSRYPAGGDYPVPTVGGPQAKNPGYYDGNNMAGMLQEIPKPVAADLAAGATTVARNNAFAGLADTSGTQCVIPAGDATAGQSPIKHVVYIVRENRTYDQVYGDLAKTRNDVDADPAYESLAAATPNGHKVVGRYASSDSFFSDGEASVQGHYWTTSANTSDYLEKSWGQYYSARNHTGDSVGTTISAPKGCSIFQSAMAKAATDPTFTYKDYGDPVGVANPAIAGTSAVTGQGPGTAAGTTPTTMSGCGAVPAANADLTNFGNFLGLKDTDSATRFLTDNGLTATGDATPGTNTLKSFSYLELPLDHTTGFTAQGPTNVNGLTPRAEVANNDQAVGTVISALSKASSWSSTAVFVVEDDSQDGPDHVDGHRNVLLVASPYAKQQSANSCYPGYVSHAHNDQSGVIRTMELMLGLPSLSTYDSTASPLYDLFQAKNMAAQLTPQDLAPFDPAAPAPFVAEKVGDPSAGTAVQQGALRAQSSQLNLSGLDQAGPGLEMVLWNSTRGLHGTPAPASLRFAAADAQARALAGPSNAGDDETAGTASSKGSLAARQASFRQAAAAAVDCGATVASGPSPTLAESPLAIGLPVAALLGGLVLAAAGRRRRTDRNRL